MSSGLQLKKVQTADANVQELFQKLGGGGRAIVSGSRSRQSLQQHSTSACFIGPVKCIFLRVVGFFKWQYSKNK